MSVIWFINSLCNIDSSKENLSSRKHIKHIHIHLLVRKTIYASLLLINYVSLLRKKKWSGFFFRLLHVHYNTILNKWINLHLRTLLWLLRVTMCTANFTVEEHCSIILSYYICQYVWHLFLVSFLLFWFFSFARKQRNGFNRLDISKLWKTLL